MKRLISLIFLFAIPASASVSRLGSGTGTTSFTLSGILTSTTLQIGFAFRTNATAPATPAGWTAIPTGNATAGVVTGTSSSIKIACRISSTAASGTWTNATNVVGVAYGGVPSVSTSANCATFLYTLSATGTDGLLECKTSTNCTGASATSIVWRALANATGDSTAWYAGFVGGSAASFCAPTGASSVATTGDVDLYDTNGTVSGFAGSTCTISSENYIQFGVEILAAPSACSGCTPSRVTISKTPDLDNGATTLASGQTIYVPLAWPTTAGNDVIVHIRTDPSTSTVTATDTANSAYAVLPQCSGSPDSGNNINDLIAYNVASGITGVTVKAGAATTSLIAFATEVKNVGTVDAAVCGESSSSTTMAGGSITTHNSGDYLDMFSGDSTATGANTGPFTAGSNTGITWKLAGVENFQAIPAVLQDGTLSTASTISPTITQNAAAASAALTLALVPTNQGGSPSGFYKCAQFSNNVENGATGTPWSVQEPVCGTNPGVGILVDGPATCPSPASYLTTTPTSTITTPTSGCEVDSGNQVFEDAFYITPSNLNTTSGIFTLTTSITSTGGDRGHNVSIYSGGSTSHFFDKQTIGQGNYAGSTSLTLLSVTPTNACSEITDAGDSHAFDTTESISAPAGGWLANGWFSLVSQNGNTYYYNNNSLATAPSSSTSSFNITVGFVRNNGVNVQNWAANSMTFESAACTAGTTIIKRRGNGVY